MKIAEQGEKAAKALCEHYLYLAETKKEIYRILSEILVLSRQLGYECSCASDFMGKYKLPLSLLSKKEGDSIEASEEKAFEEFLVNVKKGELAHLLLPICETIKREKRMKIRLHLFQWVCSCAGVLYDKNTDQIDAIKKSRILKDIYLHPNPFNRFAFVRQLSLMNPKDLEEMPVEAEAKKWSKLSWILLCRLKQLGFSDHFVNSMLEKINRITGFKDTKRFNTLVELLIQVIKQRPYQQKEIEKIEEALTKVLNRKAPKKLKKGSAPRKKVIHLISNDLQTLSNIMKLFGKKEFLGCLNSTKEYHELFLEKFQTLFEVDDIKDFGQRYQNTFGRSRKMARALETYLRSVNKLPPNQRKAVKKALDTFVNAVLMGTFPSIRYDVEQSPHLKTLFEQSKDLKNHWLTAEEPQVIAKEEALQTEQVNYKEFFYHKIITDHHLNPNEFPLLREYLLKGKELTPEKPEEPKAIFQTLAIDLCEGREKAEDFVKKVKKLKLPLGLFKNDLQSLLPQKNSGEYKISESDDPCDLLLIGTEIVGSCMAVGGDPKMNKCLTSYLMNGEIRPIVVKKRDKLIARGLLRLMWDEQNKTPALLLERVYSNVADKAVKNAIQTWAKEKAKKVGIPLVSKEVGKGEPYPGTVEFLGGFAPYVYSDASGGIFKGPFKTRGCHILFTP